MRELTDETFAAAVRGARPVLVDFTAPWCGPCRSMEPALHALASARADVEVVTLDVDESPAIGETFGIRSLPTFILFRGGAPVAQLVGAQSRERLSSWLDDQLAR